MARRLRFVPDGGSLVEVTTRTLQGRFLLKPSPRLNSIVLGVLGRAQRRYGVTLHAFVFFSNHYRAPRGADLPCGLRGPPGFAAADPRS